MRTASRALIDCTDTEPIVRCRAVRRALIERLHRSHSQPYTNAELRSVEEPNQARASISARLVTESNQSNVVKLEPSAGPTLFPNRMTTDRSTTVTAIRIQYCTSYMTRTGIATRKGPVQRQQYDISDKAPRKW